MMMKSAITRSCDISEAVYEDPDAPLPDVTDGGQSVFKVRNVRHPWFRTRSKSLCIDNNSIVDPADTTKAGSSQLSGYPPDYKMLRPVRPPPRPPLHSHKYMTSSKPTGDGGGLYMTSISEEIPQAVRTEEVSPTRPERPPLPSSRYSRCSTMRLKPESCTDESQQSRCSYISSMQQPPVSPADTTEQRCTDESQNSYISSMQEPPVSPVVSEANICGTYSTTIDYKSSIDDGQQSKCSTQQPPVSPAGSKEEVNIYGTSSTLPPAVNSERLHSPTRPERPPLPSSRCSLMGLKSESCTDESQQSRCSYISSMQQPPVSPADTKEQVTVCGTSSTTSCTDESQNSYISSMQEPPVSPVVSEVNICGTYSTTIDYKSSIDDGQQSKCSTQQPPVSPAGSKEEVNIYETSSNLPPAVNSERLHSPTRPERPPLPSSRCSIMGLKSERSTDESQQSRCSYISSMQQPPVSPVVSEVNICGTYSTVKCKSDTDKSQQSKFSTQQPPDSPAVPKEEPQAVRTEEVSPTRPERPPLPSSRYSRCSTMRLKPESGIDESQQFKCSMQQPPSPSARSKEEVTLCGTSCATSCTDERQQSSISSKQQPPVSPAVSESATDDDMQSKCSMKQPPVSPTAAKELNVCGTYGSANKSPDIPELPPRHGKLSSPKTTTPPPPSFTPPPPPSTGKLEQRPYLDVLPEDVEKMTQEKPTIRYHTGPRALTLQQSVEDTEDINGMLRWLKRVSKSDLLDPSVYGLCIEEEIRSFSQRAMNVRKALRLYNLLMMKRNESLRNIITEFTSISDSLDKLKKKGKTMEIAGGTTGAVGGVTAVLGIAFAPMSLGTSLIATAIGAGMVASAGGMGAHSAKANKKIVNKMAVEKLVYEYKGYIVDLENCLSFILNGMNELRMHDIARLQRAGIQPEVLKVAHLSQTVFKNTMGKDSRTTIAHMGGMSSERLILAFVKDMDHYFTEKDGLKLKKSNKTKFSVRVRLLAENLQDELYHLNHMWEMFG